MRTVDCLSCAVREHCRYCCANWASQVGRHTALGVVSFVLFAAPVFAAARSAPAPASSSASPPLSSQELAEFWEAQRTEIATAEIRFRCFNGGLENSQNGPDHIAGLLAEHDLA